jgi:alkanesulfonate monooxygenase SsuD/methylene tetrahydromethanopterin reductase-like flavin-dependent oxidoreductase (luciferase family)
MSNTQSPNANILWFLPTHGDGRYLGTTTGGREVNFNYLRQIAQAADQLGYFGVLLPTGRSCEDSWVVASAVAPWTERLRYLVAVRPGLQSPSVAEAWKAADDLIQHVTDETVASAQKIFSRMDSVGQQRMAQLHGGRRDVGLVRGGAGTALVGDPQTVAARIREYQDVGVDTFIMSGYPHLEEAYRFAELVFPLLSLELPRNVTPLRVNTGPFGETIANEHRPQVKASQS